MPNKQTNIHRRDTIRKGSKHPAASLRIAQLTRFAVFCLIVCSCLFFGVLKKRSLMLLVDVFTGRVAGDDFHKECESFFGTKSLNLIFFVVKATIFIRNVLKHFFGLCF